MSHRFTLSHLTYVGYLALAVFTLPSPLYLARAGLDPSWIVGLHLALKRGLVFGRDIVFSYGPLGYLRFPLLIDPYLWISSLIFRDIVHVAFFLSLATFASCGEDRILSIIVLGFTAPIFIDLIQQSLYVLAALLVILLYVVVSSNRSLKYLHVLAFIPAFSFYIKVDAGLLSFASYGMAIAWIFLKGRRWRSLTPLMTYVAWFVLLGILFTRSLETYVSFLVGYIQVAVGYGDAMSIDLMPPWLILFPIMSSIVLLGLCVMKPSENKTIFFLLSSPFLFITFKHGFVREDLHVLTFFGGWFFFCLLLQSIIGFRRGGNMKALTLLLALLLLFSGIEVVSGFTLTGQISAREQPSRLIASGSSQFFNFIERTYSPSKFINPLQTVNFIAYPQEAVRIFNSSVADLREAYPLSNTTLTMLNGHTVDVVPWDISLAYAYDLQWDPAPVFQTYSAYTTYLDDLNAHHYERPDSPVFVLYSFRTIDYRYPPFDAPRAFRALGFNYRFVTKDGEFFVLQKMNTTKQENLVLVSVQETRFGQLVEVPVDTHGSVVARVFVEPNLMGKGMSLIYKIPSVKINLAFNNGRSDTYRFVTATGSDGLLLRGRPLEIMFKVSPIDRFTILTDGPQFYGSVIRIEFYRLG